MLRLRNLSLAFGTQQLLQDLSLQLSEGELCWLKGFNGSGKSSLLKSICGIIPEYIPAETKGEIWLDEINLQESPLREKHHHLWFAHSDPETQFLMPTCETEIAFALENMGVEADHIKHAVSSSLNLFGLQNCRFQAPQTLSRGQQKLLLCAIGNALDPPLYLLDEPFSGLSESSIALVLTWIQLQKAMGKIFIVAEHGNALRHLADQEIQLIKAEVSNDGESIYRASRQDPILPPFESTGSNHDPKCEEPLFQAKNLSFAYPDSESIFRGLSVSICKGKNILLQGENGSGKSTFLKLMLGLIQPQTGSVALMGKPNRAFSAEYFRYAYYQPQNTCDSLLGLSVSQNRQFWRYSLPELPKYSQSVDPLLTELSAGEQKLVSQDILPFITDKFWLLDEPFASLDATASENLRNLIAWKARNRPGMIIVSHASDDLAGLFDEIWTIKPAGIEVSLADSEAEQQ